MATAIDEVKEACRKDDYERVPLLFDKARKSLISARESHRSLDQEDMSTIQKTLVFFKAMELEVLKSQAAIQSNQKTKFIKSLIEISEEINSLSAKAKMGDQR